jgi:hypothetical protein
VSALHRGQGEASFLLCVCKLADICRHQSIEPYVPKCRDYPLDDSRTISDIRSRPNNPLPLLKPSISPTLDGDAATRISGGSLSSNPPLSFYEPEANR